MLEHAPRRFGGRDRGDSLETATTLLNDADCLPDMSNRSGARAALRGALAIRERLLPSGDEGIAEARNRLAAE